jgi:hypothetical protein
MNPNLQTWAMRWGIPPQALSELLAVIEPAFTPQSDPDDSDEGAVMAEIRLDAPKYGARLWRNNRGAAVNPNGQPVRFGLGNDSSKIDKVWKSHDLIGIGLGGRFLSVECKKRGWRGPRTEHEHAQAAFGRTVIAHGGLATFATCAADVRRAFGIT